MRARASSPKLSRSSVAFARQVARAEREDCEPERAARLGVARGLGTGEILTYDVAEHLKRLRSRMLLQVICDEWAKAGAPFKISSCHVIPDPHT